MHTPIEPAWQELREELSAALRHEDEAVLQHFYQEHVATVYRFVLCRLDQDHAEAEDVVSQVFYQAFRDFERYDGLHAPGAWLQGIARHRIQDALRRKGRRDALNRVVQEVSGLEIAEPNLESTSAPEFALEKEETQRAVEWVLSALPPEYEQILRLHYVEDLPVKEISEKLGLTFKTAEARLLRSREAFRSAYRRLLPASAQSMDQGA